MFITTEYTTAQNYGTPVFQPRSHSKVYLSELLYLNSKTAGFTGALKTEKLKRQSHQEDSNSSQK